VTRDEYDDPQDEVVDDFDEFADDDEFADAEGDDDVAVDSVEDDTDDDPDDDSSAAAESQAPNPRAAAPSVGLQILPVTGEPRVDDALARLTDLASLPVDEHVGVFEDVQRRLHDTLADLSGQ
jgi:hypothetical protein